MSTGRQPPPSGATDPPRPADLRILPAAPATRKRRGDPGGWGRAHRGISETVGSDRDLLYGREYAQIARRRRRVLLVLLGLTTVALLAVIGLTRLRVARTSGPRPVASTGTVATAIPAPLTLRPVVPEPERHRTYTVRAGDTVDGIASRFGRAAAAIVGRNRLATPDHLTIGQRLVIPAAPTLRVAVGRSGPSGVRVRLAVRAEGGEQVVFAIRSPVGEYTGPARPVDPDGRVHATYDAPPTPGRYDVTATGDRGTVATAAFDLVAG